ALKQWKEAVIRYTREANQEVNQANIDAMEDGMAKEIRQIQARTEASKKAWQQHLLQLAEQMKASEKMIYLSKKGNTEEGWEASERGRMSTADYANEILARPENADMAEQYYDRLRQIVTTGENQITTLRQKYQDKWVKDYGTTLQKNELAQREWFDRLKRVQAEAPELYGQVWDAMEKDMASRGTAVFKESINWSDVFGDIENQSLQSLEYTLAKVREYFNRAKGDMSVTEIKDFQEAIANMEDEIASRNPFTAMHRSFSQISSSKTELVSALQEFTNTQNELNAATDEYNQLNAEHSRLLDIKQQSNQNDEIFALEQAQEKLIQSERDYQTALQNRESIQEQINSGELAADCQELANANEQVAATELARNEALAERDAAQALITDQEAAEAAIQLVTNNEQLVTSLNRVTTAEGNATKAEQRVLTARNNVTKSYKKFAQNLKSAGGVVTDIGGKATKLAKIFSDDVGGAMEKSIDFISEVLDATADVISAIGDVGKSVAKGMTQTVDAMGTATKATATATATSISTVEKASIILTVISAALQIATAIANLFNNDDAKQKEIERLQERIDQLQWELDNADTVRLQNNTADAIKKLSECYRDAYNEVLRLHGATQNSSIWAKWIIAATHSAEIYGKTVSKLADYWASVNYTADKALGEKKYDESRKQLENLAQQQLLLQQQINEESSKKKSDSGKIQGYKNQIAELAEEMATLINEMLEDIMGTTAEDLSKTLGDAFFDAVAQGEDAMKSWAATTKQLVGDIIKQMLVTNLIEGEIGKIFDKYKTKWFGTDGQFKGTQAVIDSADDLANEIDAVGEAFSQTWDALSGSLGKWFEEDSDREGTSKGIATASQESVDENNARLTTIQGHTYTLVQGVNELNGTANAMLERLTGIENNTTEANEKLDTVNARIKTVADTLETIQTSGLRLK
ncbi:MAG: hypothetical protein NC548_65355, partial [Lachnospiraceae bacterium]|nr:hypothetical protein [Lachnospiraceae bacterium]